MELYNDQLPGIKQKIVFEELVLTGKRPPLIPLIILGTFTLVFLLFVPLLIIILISSNGFHPKLLFGVALAALPGVFFLKLFLWNLYGKEIIQIEADGIRSFCDYKYFIGRKKHLSGVLFYCDIIEMEHSENRTTDVIDEIQEEAGVKFGIRNDEAMILSHFSVPIAELVRFIDRVNSLEEKLPKIKLGDEEEV
ncbi:MAG: hypothetical protein A3D31_18560 [Candidatus Fluviicola riflensis]|nr:MAG: hypothetical protein CHH17_03600 [Candidatus Fluviicola riflensis]OGS76450.1 MAG: hypothetical protein A3D31_18560 [Candidatus Fluviicola riflensis]OGS82744.1 MAG: hypothetical protein A2724_13385 [Fluviicola sp. RIFCSPHIGHO2_01_FULL_43_53]OGS89043.1 MAG: hypothetical protein A3E30_17045 [Fluviicola sp. RIFCSPHIGHO2_12_FULL_43_24]